MLRIVKEINSFELKDELWSGALDTLNTVIQNDKLQDLMDLLEEMYPEPVSITTINDLLWFDDEFLFEQLDMDNLVENLNNFENDTCSKSL